MTPEKTQSSYDELEPYTTGRPRTTDLREILNAIFIWIKPVVHGVTCQQTFPLTG